MYCTDQCVCVEGYVMYCTDHCVCVDRYLLYCTDQWTVCMCRLICIVLYWPLWTNRGGIYYSALTSVYVKRGCTVHTSLYCADKCVCGEGHVMMYCTDQCVCTVLYWPICMCRRLYCTYCTVLYQPVCMCKEAYVLYCTVLTSVYVQRGMYCTALYYIVLHFTVLYCIELDCTYQYVHVEGGVLYCTHQCVCVEGGVLYCTLLYCRGGCTVLTSVYL